MTGKIKVLQINHDSSVYSGVSVFLMNVYRNIDHNKIQIDFLTPDTSSYKIYREEIEQAGGHIFEFHINCNSLKGELRFGKRLREFLTKQHYDIVHINSGAVGFDCITAVASRLTGAKVIVHSHNTGHRSWWKTPLIFLMKFVMQKNADVLCACSMEAARYVFTSHAVQRGDVIIVKNGIDLQKFQYNKKTRNEIKKELNLDDQLVVGHIGRFAEQKNHEFLIDIFAEIIKKKPTSVLLLIGQGELEDRIKEKVYALKLQDNVIFLGQRSDAQNLYQAMDVLVFPSLFEGLPITLIEAQTSGLPCCISDSISPEVDMTPLIHRISLNTSVIEWANTALNITVNDRQRRSYVHELMGEGYDIRTTALLITKIYEDILKE